MGRSWSYARNADWLDGVTSATGTVGTSLASQDWTNVFESTDILRTANGNMLHEHDDGATFLDVGETRTFGHVRDLGRNVVAVVDESGTVVERYAYAAHGESVDPTTGAPLSCGATCGSVAGTVVGYRSMRRLGYGDAYDARFRVYDTRLRQFWSMDPLGWVDGYDRWMYVGGDAVNGWDPWGLWDLDDPAVGGLAGSADVVLTSNLMDLIYSNEAFFPYGANVVVYADSIGDDPAIAMPAWEHSGAGATVVGGATDFPGVVELIDDAATGAIDVLIFVGHGSDGIPLFEFAEAAGDWNGEYRPSYDEPALVNMSGTELAAFESLQDLLSDDAVIIIVNCHAGDSDDMTRALAERFGRPVIAAAGPQSGPVPALNKTVTWPDGRVRRQRPRYRDFIPDLRMGAADLVFNLPHTLEHIVFRRGRSDLPENVEGTCE